MISRTCELQVSTVICFYLPAGNFGLVSTSCVAWRELRILFLGEPPFTGARLKLDMVVLVPVEALDHVSW